MIAKQENTKIRCLFQKFKKHTKTKTKNEKQKTSADFFWISGEIKFLVVASLLQQQQNQFVYWYRYLLPGTRLRTRVPAVPALLYP